jgi:hypothetical protein
VTANKAIPALCAAALVALAGCGGAPAAAPEAAAPRPRNAAAIAQAIVSGRTSVLLYAERARAHPITPKLLGLEVFRGLLDNTGIDPQKDLSRAFVTAPDVAHPGEELAVLEHTVDDARLHAAIDALIGRSTPSGAWLDGTTVPEARVVIRGQTRVLALPAPGILLILPESRAADAARFEGTGGFPDPTGDEAAVATAIDPSQTLRAQRVPAIPASLRTAEARVVLRSDGGARLALDAVSTSTAQAAEDAGTLADAVDQATSVKLGFFTVRAFKQVPFRAEGDHVKAELDLSAGELDMLVGLAAGMASR